MTVHERVKQVRKENGLTLEKFGERIGIKKTSMSQIETGRSNPSDQTIRSICREFGIREEWLRTGEGEMTAPESSFSLDEYAQQNGASELEREFIRLYLEMPQEIRQTMISHFREGLTRLTQHSETPEERHERHKREARAEAEEYYQEVLAEKTAEENSQVSGTQDEEKAV